MICVGRRIGSKSCSWFFAKIEDLKKCSAFLKPIGIYGIYGIYGIIICEYNIYIYVIDTLHRKNIINSYIFDR